MWRNEWVRRGTGAGPLAKAIVVIVFGLGFLAFEQGLIHAGSDSAQETYTPRVDRVNGIPYKATASGVIRYVNGAVLASGAGTSWATAYKSIQEGIDAVAAAGSGEVWVAQGIYNEARTSAPHGDGINTGSVMMKAGVHLYGGFAGTETARDQRDWNAHSTVISGGKTRDGLDAYHVIVGAEPATLDGFVVTGGSAIGANEEANGGGMYNNAVSPLIQNCIFRGNDGQYNAGMANANGASPTIIGCTFNANSASVNAGGIGNWGASACVIRDCSFIANGATRMGAGVFEGNGAHSTISNCVFRDNTAGRVGGGVANYSNGLSKIINCVFIHNTVTETSWGGGGVGSWQSSPSVMNCSFTLNVGAGAAVYTDTDSTEVTNCILWNDSGGEVKGAANIAYSDVQGGHTGVGNINADPLYVDAAKYDLQLAWGSPCADAGTASGAPTTDIAGALRPCGRGYDMGAYELPQATLRGLITDQSTGAPLNCAAVTVTTAGSVGGKVVSADLNGWYRAAGLPLGTYQITVYAPRHTSQTKSLTLGAGVTGWSFELAASTLSGAVYGTCRDRDRGQPLAGICVRAYIKGVLKGTTYTGACGRYDINHLVGLTAKGTTEVTVDFSSDGYDSQQSTVDVPTGGSAEASPSLAPKSAVPGSVTGVITSSQTGQPLSNARVTSEGVAYVTADTDSNGVYALSVLPEGSYTLIASATGFQGSTCVQYVASATENVDFALTPTSQSPAEDINSDCSVNAIDVQLVINSALGIATGMDCDVDCSNSVDAVDVQKVINGALGV